MLFSIISILIEMLEFNYIEKKTAIHIGCVRYKLYIFLTSRVNVYIEETDLGAPVWC